VSRLEALEWKLCAHPLWADPLLLPRLVALQHKEAMAAAARAARKELKAAQVRLGGGEAQGLAGIVIGRQQLRSAACTLVPHLVQKWIHQRHTTGVPCAGRAC
jgi:hypothetical protein